MGRKHVAVWLLALFILLPLGGLAEDNATSAKTVLVVLVYDKGCYKWCQEVRPLMKDIENSYLGRVTYVELDASPDALPESTKTARQLVVYSFLSDAADWVPWVGVFNTHRKLIKELVGPKKREVYID